MNFFGGKSSNSSCSFSISFSQSQQTQDEDLDLYKEDEVLNLSEVSVPAAKYLQQYLTTGCTKLDDFLKGGIPCFGITEFVGESGNGKTQLCLQLCLTVQLPVLLGGFAAGAIYINTESCFPSSRLAELTTHFKLKYGNHLPEFPMDKIVVEHVPETIGLLKCIKERLPTLIENKKGNFRLIIVDSIAALFRTDYDESSQEKRTADLRHIGKALHAITTRYNIAVVVVNQVSGSPSHGGNIPALGLAWANMITSRINVARNEKSRILQIMFAPHVPNVSTNFVVTSEGVKFSVIN